MFITFQTTGSFPDPYDCNSYHVCSESNGNLISTKRKCPDERAYDSLTATCRFKSNHEVCRKSPVPPCENTLQTEAIKQNPNMYFVCVMKNEGLEHVFYKCPAGHEFHKNVCSDVGFKRITGGQYKDEKDKGN